MNDQYKASSNGPTSENASLSDVTQQLSSTPAKPDAATELHELEKQTTKFEKSTLRWSRVAVIMSSLAALFVSLQWWEMHTSSRDTHDLAVAAGKQATAADTQSKQAIEQTNKMGESLSKTQSLVEATNTLAKEAHGQANIAREALKASVESADQDRRPWVGVLAIRCDDCRSDEHGGLSVGQLAVVIMNTGKTPAVNMTTTTVATAAPQSQGVPDIDAILKESNERTMKAFSDRPTYPPNIPPQLVAEMEAQRKKTLDTVIKEIAPPRSVLAPNGTNVLIPIGKSTYGPHATHSMDDWKIVYSLGKITYHDTKGKEHTTRFCLMNRSGADFNYCSTGNTMD